MEVRGRIVKKYIYLIVFFTVLGLGAWRGNIWMKNWMTEQSLSGIQEMQKYVLFEWGSMDVNAPALKVYFTDVLITPQPGVAAFQQEITPKKLTVQIAPWASLIHKSIMLNIMVEDFNYQIPLSDSSQKGLALLKSLPINKVSLKSAHLELVSPKGIIKAPQVETHLRKSKDGFYLKVKSKPILKNSSFSLQSRLYLTEEQTEIISLNIKSPISELSLSGKIAGGQNLFFDFQSNFDAKDLNAWIEHWRDPLPIQGFFNIKSQIKYTSQDGWTGPFEFLSKNFLLTPINLSQIKIKGTFENHIIKLEMAHLEKEKGYTSYFENTQIHLNKDKTFKLKNYSSIENFHAIENLLNWKNQIQFQGQMQSDCTGNWSKLHLECSLMLRMQNLYMNLNSLEDPSIFAVEKGQTNADFTWTPDRTDFKGQLKLGSDSSSLPFKGVIENNQAKISFNGPLNFDHIQSIYGFNVKGFAPRWKGTMILGKKGVLIDSSLHSKNLYFSKYLFGDVKTDLKINNQGLYLNKIRAKLGKSRYKGHFHILFKKEKIQSQAQFSPLFLEDLSLSVKDLIPAPLNFVGKGRAKWSMDSPLKNLNYQIDSKFQNVKMYNEFFRSLTFNVLSKDGQAQITKAVAEKLEGSSIQADGVLNNSNELDLNITGSRLPVEKSENLNRWMTGILNFQMNVTGPITKPKGEMSGTILTESKNPLAKFTINLTPDQISGQGDFFNDSLLIRKFKFLPNQNNVSFSATANQWDFIPFTRGASPLLMVSELTGTTSLHFSKDLKTPSGFADIKEIKIQYGLQQSSHSGPVYMEFNKGKFSFRGSTLKWKTNEKEMIVTKIDDDHSRVSGVMGLEIFSFFFPQIKNIRGDLQADLKIQNNFNQLSPEGRVQVENGMINISSHINPFQSIALNGTLKSQIMHINQLTALTPLGGNVKAVGLIDFSEPDLLPLEISAQLNGKTAVYISDKIHGMGYGSVKIYGDKAPYTLSGIFNVRTGAFNQEFDSAEDSKDIAFLEPGSGNIYPFYWDLKVNFDNPFPVENTLFSSLLTGSLHLKGDFLNPNASGRITFIPGGKFYIRDYDFEITSGRLNYNSKSIYKPQLQIIGVTQFEETQYNNERETTNQYNITANITGTPGNFRFELSSQPALSESDILSMMALGARSIGDSSIGFSPVQIAQSQVAKYSYAQIGAVLFQDIFGRELSKSLGLRLSFTPYMSLSKNKPSNKIGVHKRWFEKMNTSYIGSTERDYDSFKVEYLLSPTFSLLGVWEKKEILNQDQSNTLGVEFEYKLDF